MQRSAASSAEGVTTRAPRAALVSRASRFLGGPIWQYYVGFGLSRIATVVSLPILSRLLGPRDYGYFEVSFALMLAAMILADAGFGAGLVRFFGDDPPESLLATARRLQVFASAIAFVVFAAPSVLLAPPGASSVVILSALALYTFIEGFGVLGAGVLRVTERFGTFLGLSTLRIAVALAGGALGAWLGGAAGALYGVALAGLGFAVVAVRHLEPVRRPPTAAIRTQLLHYGLPLISAGVMVWALSLSDRLFLRVWVSPLELSTYATSYRLGGLTAVFVAGPLALAWVPVARRAASRVERDRICLRWSTRVSLISLGGGVLLVAASNELVPLVFGSGFRSEPVVVAAVAVSGWLFALYFLIATEILLGESTRALGVVTAIVVAFNLAANAVLIPVWGTRGAALATLLSYLALCAATGVAGAKSAPQSWLLHPRHVLTAVPLLALVAVAVHHGTVAMLGLAVLCPPLVVLSRRFGLNSR